MRWISVWLLALALLAPNTAFAQATGQVTGTVTSGAGRPLAGASVAVAGTRLGALTGADGRYTITGVPAGRQTVRASVVGYNEGTQQVTVAAGQSAAANFQLSAAAVQLEEIVATGYGTARRRDVTGAIAKVSGEELAAKAAPTSAVSNALQGKAPGVQVIVNSGVPGAGSSVRIRGTASISANSEPLYVVDGIPAAQGTGSHSASYNPLNQIDPNNVESIEILKDASATAIYGARGANGVVLITTKRGKRGENIMTLESSYGIQEISKTINPLTGPQFMELVNEGYVNSGRKPRYTAEQIASAPTYNYVDLMTQRAPQQSHGLTFSGGDDKTRYLVSGNYLNQEGILVRSGFERYGLRVNLDREMSDRFRLGTSLSMTRTEQQRNRVEDGGIGAGANGVLGAMNFDPTLAPRNDKGEWNKRAVLGEQLDNPFANAMEIENPRRESRLVGNIFGELDLTDGLRLKSTVGGNFGFERSPYFAPRTIAPGGVGGVASMYSDQQVELINENTLNYRRELGNGNLDLLGGFSAQTYNVERQYSSAWEFPTDAFKWNNLGAAKNRGAPSTGATDWTLLSSLGRANYSLADKYLFTVTGRYDGSSRFGANNKWAFFPSAAFAWRVIDEGFMQDQGLFDDLKLRLSYGKTGNQAVSEYQSLARMDAYFAAIGKGSESMIMYPSGAAPNPDLKWETTGQYNAGLDMGFIDNRLTVSLDAYHSVTNDLLLWTGLPATSGYGAQLQNIGSVQNRGVELGINTINFEGDNFSWRSTLNVSANRNEVRDLGGVDEIFPGGSRYGWFLDGNQSHIVRVGEPLGSIYGYQVDGLWQQGEQCYLKKAAECTPGEYKVADLNNDGFINSNDRTIVGYADPKFYGGFTNNLSYGPFSLDAFLNFSYGNKIANVSRVFTGLSTGFLNESEEVLDRWTPTNTNTMVPRANNARARRLYSTLVEDGSFLRLQTLTLGYQVPSGLIPGAESARLYLTGQNLFVLTNYSGFDPEVNSIGGDARLRGVDSGAYPRARVVNVGVNLTF